MKVLVCMDVVSSFNLVGFYLRKKYYIVGDSCVIFFEIHHDVHETLKDI